MARKTFTPDPAAAREKAAAARQQIEAALVAMTDSDAFKRWVTLTARLHHYSLNNTLLIGLQKPDATYVAGYKTWQSLGRQVRKGEKGIRILAPRPYTQDTGEDGIFFATVPVFDISQTDGDDIGVTHGVIEGDDAAVATAYRRLAEWATTHGVQIVDGVPASEMRGADGSYRPGANLIRLRAGLTGNYRMSVLTHEVAHWRAGHVIGGDSAEAETVAEVAATIVMATLGVDTTAHSAPYVAEWAKDMATIKLHLSTAQRVAQEIIEALNAPVKEV